MTSTTARYPVKAKTLTLLELCQTINDLRYTSSTSTAQILTRRLYLHPLTISNNAKQHASKLATNNLPDIEQYNQSSLERKPLPRKHAAYHGLQIFSSSLPLTSRTNTKLNSSITTDNDSSTLNEISTTTISTNHTSLPPISRGTSSTSKRTISTRSSYISQNQRTNFNYIQRPPEKVDVWHHLARTLQRPMPKDPPTTPFEATSDYHLQIIEESEQEQNQQPQNNYNSIQEIKIYKRNPVFKSFINENINTE
jgi:hypothetical protein